MPRLSEATRPREAGERVSVKCQENKADDMLLSSAMDAFVPPRGLKKAAAEASLNEFSLESLKRKFSSGCELWAIRLPDGVSINYLQLESL